MSHSAVPVTSEMAGAAGVTRRQSRWAGPLGDAVAAAVVLLGGGVIGGGLLQGTGLLGFAGAPPALGLAPGPRDMGGPADPQLSSNLLYIFLLLISAALVVLRRRWPIVVSALTAGMFAVAVLFGWPSLGPGIAMTIAAYAFAFRAPRRLVLIAVAGVLVVVMVLAFAVTGWESLDPRVFQVGAASAIAAALGDSARSRQEYLMQMENRAEQAEQSREAEARRRVSEDRLRIARDLHDTVAHQMSVINLQAGAASGYLPAHPGRAQAALTHIREAAQGALQEIGDLLRYLREEDASPATPVQQTLNALSTLLDRMEEAGLHVSMDIRGELDRVPEHTGTVAYRVVQEGLTNAHKHGADGSATLQITVGEDRLGVEVGNRVPDGEQTGTAGTGLGVVGLRERVTALNGTLTTGVHEGWYRLSVDVPWQQMER